MPGSQTAGPSSHSITSSCRFRLQVGGAVGERGACFHASALPCYSNALSRFATSPISRFRISRFHVSAFPCLHACALAEELSYKT